MHRRTQLMPSRRSPAWTRRLVGVALLSLPLALAAAPKVASAAPTQRPQVAPKKATKAPPAMPPHKRPPPKPIGLALALKLETKEGYFDDPIAFSRDGARLAAIHTDGETFLRAEIYPLPAVA